jgi:hypothetical protein
MNKIKLIITSLLLLCTLVGFGQQRSSSHAQAQQETTLTLQLKNNTAFDFAESLLIHKGKILQGPTPPLSHGQEGTIVLQTVNQQLSGSYLLVQDAPVIPAPAQIILNIDTNNVSVASVRGLRYRQNSFNKTGNSINIEGTIFAVPGQNQ